MITHRHNLRRTCTIQKLSLHSYVDYEFWNHHVKSEFHLDLLCSVMVTKSSARLKVARHNYDHRIQDPDITGCADF